VSNIVEKKSSTEEVQEEKPLHKTMLDDYKHSSPDNHLMLGASGKVSKNNSTVGGGPGGVSSSISLSKAKNMSAA
jgi:hypothetical protein